MSSERFNELRRNKFNLFWCRFFVDLNALNSVVQLFYLQRGVTPAQIFWTGVAWSVGTLLFDIPSSYLADRWGRRKTILTGVVINVIANAYLFWAYGFWSFFLYTFIFAISYSFFFGVEDALLYDTLKEMKQERVVMKTAGKYASAGRISKILLPIVGMFIAKDLAPEQFNILLSINLISSVVAVYFAWVLVEPKRFEEKLKMKLNAFTDGIFTFLKSEALRSFAFNKSLIFIGSFVFWRFYQNALLERGFSVLYLGLIYPVSNALLVIFFILVPKITEKIERLHILNGVAYVMLFSLFIFIFTENQLALYLTSISILTVATIRDPLFTQQIQWRLKSVNRATTGSILGIFKGVSDIPVLILSGYLASYGGKLVLVLPVLLTLAVLVLFRIKKEYIISGVANE